MKQLAEQEWGIHSSQITLTNEGKKSNNAYPVVLKSEICGEMAQYNCDECKQEFCGDYCSTVHQHKKQRSQTLPNSMYDDSGPMFHVVKEVDGMGSGG